LQAYKSLQSFVQATSGGSLRKLEVQWLSSGRPISSSRSAGSQLVNGHVHRVWRDKRVERNSGGGRGRDKEVVKISQDLLDWDPSDEDTSMQEQVDAVQRRDKWAQKEIVLQPLTSLRGLKKVRIEGTVTEAWATHLEEVMTASRDQVVLDYNADESVRENELKDRDGPQVSWNSSGTYYKRISVM